MERDRQRHADHATAARLEDGDEAAFTELVCAHHGAMVRFARARIGSASPLVEESVQEAWVVFLESLSRYEARSSLRTFLFGILVNVLRNRTRSERRSVPLSSIACDPEESAAVTADRFYGDAATWAGHWSAPPRAWERDPVDDARTRAMLEAAIGTLPDTQREVLMLRDVMGWTADEVCDALSLSDANQRVLLHRARSKVRAAIEAWMPGEATWR